MGLFSSVIHVFDKAQFDVVTAVSAELKERLGNCQFSKIELDATNANCKLDEIEVLEGVLYLITPQHGAWTTIIEVNVKLENSFYPNEFVNSLSKCLDTYAISFHLHDSDVLYYNLEKSGESLDGYNSNYQYFLDGPAPEEEIISQRHQPEHFSPHLLPEGKTVAALNEILNEGYWTAYDKKELDEDGVPADFDKYYVNEEDRFERVGKYLEIFSREEYPFANWYSNLKSLDLERCYLLLATKI